MIGAEIPWWIAIPASLFLIMGGILALTGAVGLLRFGHFYARIHAPTLGNTLGACFVLGASALVFSYLSSRAVFHEVVIVILLILTSPVTGMLLMRAAVYRNRSAEIGPNEPHQEP
ncbi:monovalent cation/H(+) antiporter subunit G [Pseudomonadota bacterium AL_CKDN230030165-1A_HGKHYDSX7]